MKKRYRGIFGEPIMVEMSVLKALGFDFLFKVLSDKEIKVAEKLMDQQDNIVGSIDNKAIDKWMEKFVDVKDAKGFNKSQQELAKILKTMASKNPDAKKALDITNKLAKMV